MLSFRLMNEKIVHFIRTFTSTRTSFWTILGLRGAAHVELDHDLSKAR